MAFVQSNTLLSLDQFARTMGLNPWAFNQLDVTRMNGRAGCAVWYQYEYQQSQSLTRETIGRAIADAERMLAEALGYWPAPQYVVAEKIPYPRPVQRERWNGWFNERWKLKSVQTHYGLVLRAGVLAESVIDASVDITFSDTDGDGFDDWFESDPVPTTVTDIAEIAAYVRDSDRPEHIMADGDCWRIRPVNVVISGGEVTINGPKWLVTNPNLWIAPEQEKLDPTTAASYLTAIKVGRRYTDTSDQGSVSLEHVNCYGDDCPTIQVPVCFGERDLEAGYLLPEATEASYPLGPPGSCCWSECGYAPDFVTINYYAGYPLRLSGDMLEVDPLHAQMIARLAVALLPEDSCVDCNERQINHWREELPSEQLTFDGLSNPFGTARRGAVWAYKQVLARNHRQMAGAVL